MKYQLWFTFIVILAVGIISIFSCNERQNEQKVEALPYFHTPDFTPIWIEKKSQLDTLHTLSHFEFRNQNNLKITQETFKGKIHVANFFFTICPSLCPKIMGNMQAVQMAFKNDSNILIASYSVLPNIDSVATLRKYANVHGIEDGKWHLMTGDKKMIYKTARKGYFADENLGVQKDENDFLHTENFILIDRNLHIRGIYNGTLPLEIEQLIADIKTLKLERK
jgi:protein SCO1